MKSKFKIEGYDPESGAVTGTHERIGTGYLRTPQEGQPLQAGEEFVRVEAREGNTLHLETLYAHKGPSRSNSKAYRDNYDKVFNKALN